MAKSKDDIKYGTSQSRLSEDEATRVAYKHGTPIEGGKIADSELVDIFASARNISESQVPESYRDHCQSQMKGDPADVETGSTEFTTGAPPLPKEGPPPAMNQK